MMMKLFSDPATSSLLSSSSRISPLDESTAHGEGSSDTETTKRPLVKKSGNRKNPSSLPLLKAQGLFRKRNPTSSKNKKVRFMLQENQVYENSYAADTCLGDLWYSKPSIVGFRQEMFADCKDLRDEMEYNPTLRDWNESLQTAYHAFSKSETEQQVHHALALQAFAATTGPAFYLPALGMERYVLFGGNATATMAKIDKDRAREQLHAYIQACQSNAYLTRNMQAKRIRAVSRKVSLSAKLWARHLALLSAAEQMEWKIHHKSVM